MAETQEAGRSYAGVILAAAPEAKAEADAPMPRVSSGTQVINDTELTYAGRWESLRILPRAFGYSNNTCSSSREAGAEASYAFSSCEGIAWYAAGRQARMQPQEAGEADVYVDGVFLATVRASQEKPDVPVFTTGPLKKGPHTLRLVARSAQPVEIDRLEALGEPAYPLFISSRNGAYMHVSPGFAGETCPPAKSGWLTAAAGRGERFFIGFAGPQLRLYGRKGPDGGCFSVTLDGTFIREVDCRAEKETASALLFSADGLSGAGFHMLEAETLGGCVAIDGCEIWDNRCLMTVINRRTDEETGRMARYETTATDPADWKPVTLPGKIPLKNVRLTSGVFRQIFQRNIQYLKDSLKKPQWVDAKDPDRIWVDMLVASNEGRMLGGMGNTLRYAEEPAFREAIAGILDAVERRQFANWNGYLMPYESRNYRLSTDTWPAIMRDEEKNYDRAMFTKGMLAAGAAGFGEAYDMLRHFYDWFNGAEEYLPIMLLGSMAIQGSIAGPLVYHSPVGVPDDIQTNQKYYDLDWWLEYLAAGYPEAVYRFPLNRPHNYLLTSVCALFEEYTATGDEKYINACLGAWRIYHDYFQIPGGGISICEHFECKPWSHKLTNLPNNIYETCGSVFWVDLNHRFLQLWPDKELYAAEMEKSLYNIVFASQGPDGCIRYFNHMNQGKDRPGRYNTCCEIQATMLFGQLPQYIYMLRQDGVTVNLFAASSVDFCVEERPYALQMETAFPYEETVTMKVSAPQGGRMALRIRIPSWLQANAVIRVNGRDAAEGQPGSYVLLDREWTQGDTVSLALPMAFRTEAYTGENRVPGCVRAAVLYGPLLMAVQGPMSEGVYQAEGEPTIRLDKTVPELLQSLRPGEEALAFAIEGAPAYRLVPYWTVGEEPFTCFPALRPENKN